MNTLKILEETYARLLQEQNWMESKETKDLAVKYKQLNSNDKCMECGGLSTITCQFH